MQDDERCFHIPCERHWRIAGVRLPVLPWSAGKAALAALEDLAVSHTAVLVDQSVHADHIRERRAGACRREHISLRDDESRLIPTPGMCVNDNMVWINNTAYTGAVTLTQ